RVGGAPPAPFPGMKRTGVVRMVAAAAVLALGLPKGAPARRALAQVAQDAGVGGAAPTSPPSAGGLGSGDAASMGGGVSRSPGEEPATPGLGTTPGTGTSPTPGTGTSPTPGVGTSPV